MKAKTARAYTEDGSTAESLELGPESAGQSGDLQGLESGDEAESESVVELLEEGQYYEASVVSGIEGAPSADRGPIRTKQVPQDDVPAEYADEVDYRN